MSNFITRVMKLENLKHILINVLISALENYLLVNEDNSAFEISQFQHSSLLNTIKIHMYLYLLEYYLKV